MTAAGPRPEVIEQILDSMRLQYRFAETGQGWNEYIAARQRLANRFGAALVLALSGMSRRYRPVLRSDCVCGHRRPFCQFVSLGRIELIIPEIEYGSGTQPHIILLMTYGTAIEELRVQILCLNQAEANSATEF